MLSNIGFLESVVYWASIISLVALTLSFVGGATSIVVNRWLNKEKTKQYEIEKREFDKKIAETQLQIAKANEKAESEKLARVKLEARLADRILTKDQKDRITIKLTPFSGIEADEVIFGDIAEIKKLGNDLFECLRNAGWNVSIAIALGGVYAKGVLIGVRADADIRTLTAVTTLISELRLAGIDSGPWDFDLLPYPGAHMGTLKKNTPIKIFIGSKP